MNFPKETFAFIGGGAGMGQGIGLVAIFLLLNNLPYAFALIKAGLLHTINYIFGSHF